MKNKKEEEVNKKKESKAKREQESNITLVQEHYHVAIVLSPRTFTVAFGPNRNKANDFVAQLCRDAKKEVPFEVSYQSFPSGVTNSLCINPPLFAGAYLVRETVRTKIDLDVRVLERDWKPEPQTKKEGRKP
jgi:hypothetical protein